MNVFVLFAVGLSAWVVGGLLLGLLIGAIARLRDRRRPMWAQCRCAGCVNAQIAQLELQFTGGAQ